MELNETTGRIGLDFIPTYQRLVSLKRKLSLGGKPVLTGIRERGRKSLAHSKDGCIETITIRTKVWRTYK